jgi:hypothetical protein
MIAEVIDGAYDTKGKQVSQPRKRRYWWWSPTFAMGRFLTQPLSVECSNFDDLQSFLKQCRYVSDLEQFGKLDYWMLPAEFEEKKKGDCEDFALWTWRQLLAMGYDARFVGGRAGKYGSSHAWVAFTKDERTFLVESLAARLSKTFPRLSTLRYEPHVSVSWDNDRIRYYEHDEPAYDLTFRMAVPLIGEWVAFRIKHGHKIIAFRIWRYLLWAIRIIKRGILSLKRRMEHG